MKELIHTGSVKDVYQVEDGKVLFEFSDRISVFDHIIPNDIPGKGEALCDMACHWFDTVSELGIAHHFLERSGPRSMIVKQVKIIRDLDQIVDGKTNHLVPLEFILRHYCAGMLFDRIKSGKIAPAAVGFKTAEDATYGARLPKPLFEMSTKLEAVDRYISDDEAMHISKLSDTNFAHIRDACMSIDAAMEKQLEGSAIFHVDGKKEFGYDAAGTLMLVDVFGTADEDRYWDRKAYEDSGECVELSKEKVRQHYRQTGYKDKLYEDRAKGLEDPEMPQLPQQLIDETSELYRSIAKQICGK
jgi:phosphoribosylaminoimidazole-succinocarboxamide synthase